jgi:hypothetical protein
MAYSVTFGKIDRMSETADPKVFASGCDNWGYSSTSNGPCYDISSCHCRAQLLYLIFLESTLPYNFYDLSRCSLVKTDILTKPSSNLTFSIEGAV